MHNPENTLKVPEWTQATELHKYFKWINYVVYEFSHNKVSFTHINIHMTSNSEIDQTLADYLCVFLKCFLTFWVRESHSWHKVTDQNSHDIVKGTSR